MSRPFFAMCLLTVACTSDPVDKTPARADDTAEPGTTGTSQPPVDTAPPDDTATEPADPWPDPETLPDGTLSLVYDGMVVSPGDTLAVDTAPAGLPDPTTMRLVLTNRTDTTLSFPADPTAWLADGPFTWDASPPTSLDPEASAELLLSVDVSAETTASVRSATLTIPDGPSVELAAHTPRPLRIVVIGSGHYTAISDSYGAAFETELSPADDTTARDVVWGNGRFLRADRATNDWSAPGVYQWSDDGLTWHDSASSEDFWSSACTYARGQFYCVRSSSLSHSEDGSVVLHDSLGWGDLLNDITFVPEADLDRGADTGDTATGDRLVVVGRAARRLLSDDGESWTADVTSSTWTYLNAVTYADSTLVAVGGYDSMVTATSTDGGETWTEQTLCEDRWASFSSVVYGNGVFLATAQSNNCTDIWRSTDGLTWDAILDERVRVLTFANGWFIGVTQYSGYPPVLSRSTDGLSWDPVHEAPVGTSIQAATVEAWEAP